MPPLGLSVDAAAIVAGVLGAGSCSSSPSLSSSSSSSLSVLVAQGSPNFVGGMSETTNTAAAVKKKKNTSSQSEGSPPSASASKPKKNKDKMNKTREEGVATQSPLLKIAQQQSPSSSYSNVVVGTSLDATANRFIKRHATDDGSEEGRETKKPRAMDDHQSEVSGASRSPTLHGALPNQIQATFGANAASSQMATSLPTGAAANNNNSDLIRLLLSSPPNNNNTGALPSSSSSPATAAASSSSGGTGAAAAADLLRERALRAEISARELLQRKALEQAASTANAYYNLSRTTAARNSHPNQQQQQQLGSLSNSYPSGGGGTVGGGGGPGGNHPVCFGGIGDIDLSMYANLRSEIPGLPAQYAAYAGQGQTGLGTSNLFGGYRFPVSAGGFGYGMAGVPSLPPNSFLMPPMVQVDPNAAAQSQSLSSLLLQLQAAQAASSAAPSGAASNVPAPATAASPNLGRSMASSYQSGSPQVAGNSQVTTTVVPGSNSQAARMDDTSDLPASALIIPPCDEDRVLPFSSRPMYKLGMEEDPNWLSEFHCFVRSELIEVFRASHEDCKARNNAIGHHQVGIRCRFCAHISSNARAGRSSAFPSSLRQIYQSFTMMLRDHFGNCEAMPRATQDKFLALKDKPSQGATDSKRYWVYSAMKIGLADSRKGIVVTEQTRAQGAAAPPFGTSPEQQDADDAVKDVSLVLESDRNIISEFLFLLMSQSQLVRLTEAERVGNRRSLRLGLPGFGCRHCCEHRRLGLCRMFPARRRTLPSKVSDLYDHLRRCTVCPSQVKERLESLHHQMNTGFHADQGGDREFFDRVWNRLGHSKP